ncbi:MAG: Trk family potassium uptake protein [Clostridiales bacterium]|nr:Trk family potassium uptake protein [Clostridiales bacterium]
MIFPGKEKGQAGFRHAESILALGFLAVILLGTVLLALPAAAGDGKSIGLFDSLFTSTSAVCVTGLVAVDTGTAFSLFGQIVLLALIQVGGLGFMVFATVLLVMLGRKISIKGRMLIRESMNSASLSDLGSLTRLYLLLSLAIELAGTILLSYRFVPLYGWKRGLWMALFHAVSAFCNAGFDLFGGYASLTAFAGDPLVLLTVAGLIISGGLGFSVILETIRNRQGFRSLSLHTRIVLLTTFALLVAGTSFYWLAERTNAGTLAGYGEGERLLNAFFQSVTMRTAGFNSFDLSRFRDGSKLFSCFLMSVGASPASTGGGIKTTTAAALALLMLSVVRGESEVNVAKRRLPEEITRRALAVAVLFLITLLAGTLIISLIEDGRFPLADILFEASSAMGTVGVSAIGTPNLSPEGRAVLLPMMFLGRVGPLTLAVALAKRQGRMRSVLKYPEEKIMIG